MENPDQIAGFWRNHSVRRYLTIAALGWLMSVPGAAQRPTTEEQKQTLDAARDIAIHYTSKLPDFICTEEVTRANSIGAKILQSDTLTIQLSYYGQKEKQKLVKVNGKPTEQRLDALEGLITGGEFGSLLLGVFDPASAADFRWKESSTVRKRRVAVYSYRIVRAKSHYLVGYRGDYGKLVSVAAGYHGEIALDSETSRVLRLTASADDIPKGSEVTASSVEVDYDFIDVAGHSYLLPARSDARMERANRQIANATTFAGYRKFEADSTISFPPAGK